MSRMIKRAVFIAALLALLVPAEAEAAPFCVQYRGMQPQCIYHDITTCKRESIQVAAACVINDQEIRLPKDDKRFCLINSSRVIQCIYPDPDSCNSEAAKSDGICAATFPDFAVETPYQFDVEKLQ